MPHYRQGISDLAEILLLKGIQKAVICPGSRNAPLIKALARSIRIECLSVVDERVAGYFAMGISIGTGKPVAVVCSSGTAVLNLSPAVAEAYYQHVPLLLITADRPPEIIDQSDNQTIRQQNIYGRHVKSDYQLPVETLNEQDLWYSNRMVADAVNISLAGLPGPVHINVPLREPLYTELPEPSKSVRIIEHIVPDSSTGELPASLIESWKSLKKKMIICGMGGYDKELDQNLKVLSEDNSVVVLAENLANMQQDTFITAVERLFFALGTTEDTSFVPGLVVVIRPVTVSKMIKQFLRKVKPAQIWLVQKEYSATDTYMGLSSVIQAEPSHFLKLFHRYMPKNRDSSFQKDILRMNSVLEFEQEDYLQSIPWCDLKAFQCIMRRIPRNCDLHLGNSSPVRYAQLFTVKQGVYCYSNRGTSGIDGCISTAAGICYGRDSLSLLILGDLSFFYDSNALGIKNMPENLRIIVINNRGGDIFRILDTGDGTVGIEEYLETPLDFSIRQHVLASGLSYLMADSEHSLNKALDQLFQSSDRAVVLEVDTLSSPNAQTLKGLYKLFKNIQYE